MIVEFYQSTAYLLKRYTFKIEKAKYLISLSTIAITYDEKRIRVYIDRDEKYITSTSISLDTYPTNYLNIGGFLLHNQEGRIFPRDMNYSMKGYIREFMMFDQALEEEEIFRRTDEIEKKVNKRLLDAST